MELFLVDWCKYLCNGLLYKSVCYCWYALLCDQLFSQSVLLPYAHALRNAFYSERSRRIFSSLQNFYPSQWLSHIGQ